MSTSFYDLKINKNIYEINMLQNTPIKILDNPENRNIFKKNCNEINIYKKLFQINKDKKYFENILSTDIKQNKAEQVDEKNKRLNFYDDKNNFKMNLKNLLNEMKKENKIKGLSYNKYLDKSKNIKYINYRYNKYNEIKRGSIKKLDAFKSNSIDIIYNNPYNKKQVFKSLSKKNINENNINSLMTKFNNNKRDYLPIKEYNNFFPINDNYKSKSVRRKLSDNLFKYEKKSKFNYNLKKPSILKEISSFNNLQESLKDIFYIDFKQPHKNLKSRNTILNNLEDAEEKEKVEEEKNNININKINTMDYDLPSLQRLEMKEKIENIIPTKKAKIKTQRLGNKKKFSGEIKEINKNIENKSKVKEIISDDELNEYYITNCNVVMEYSYKEEINLLNRNHMEDKGKSISNFNHDPNKILFCLFDGHGGDSVSNFLQKNFAKYMKIYIREMEIHCLREIDFDELFKKIDQKLKELNYYEVGSTASIIYITKIGYKRILYCINIGDTKCILTQNNCSRKISYDDLTNDNYENNRINKGGGLIMNGRVSGKLMITRAFGDWEQKSFGVISSPHITKIEINSDHKYVIMASDGVWDVMDDLEVYSLSLEAENSKELCNEIINNSLEKGSKDNISCFVIKLND